MLRLQIANYRLHICALLGLVVYIGSGVLHAQVDTKAAAAAITKGPDGKPSESHGQYLTTWRKQKDGSWKIVYDIGSTAPETR